METKFYKGDKIYYKVSNRLEKIYAYRHCFGVENSSQVFDFADFEVEEISEAQYNRVKKLVLAKLLKPAL